MTYPEALDYINNIAQFGDKPGLDRVSALLERFGNPHHRLKFVHVAGTNGKGSVCAMAESILRASGYKTGLYISPFVEDYHERIQVNRRPISQDDVARLFTQIKSFNCQLTEFPRKFEIETAAALQYFAERKCDVVVFEVGLGGRLDATNVIPPPEVAVITSISYDHTQILGDTIEKITAEKRGIIKPGCAVVETSALPPATDEKTSLSGSTFRYKGEEYAISLIGRHQIQNAATAVETIEALRRRGWNIPDFALRDGLRDAKWGGRLEIVRDKPLCIIDGAHNRQAVEVLCEVLDTLLPGREIITVFAMKPDKPYHLCAPMLQTRSKRFIAADFSDVETSVRKALELAGGESVVLACGSLYMLRDAKRAMLDYSM